MAHRLAGRFGYPKKDPFRVVYHEDRIEEPLNIKKPSRIFVCSMGDWMHPEVHFSWIDTILEVMAACPQHTFLTLTKRPENLVHNLFDINRETIIRALVWGDYLSNLWLGVTVCNQAEADKKIPVLLNIPGFRKWISIEPILDYIWLRPEFIAKLDWIVVGAETGPGARYADPNWFRSLQDWVHECGKPFYLKQTNKQHNHFLDGKAYLEIG
jgi:protein gp37